MAFSELSVRAVMEPNPITLPASATVQHALLIMNQMRIGSVLILDDNSSLCGIFTERDLLRRVSTAVPGWRDYPVSQWMTERPHTIEPDVSWEDAVNQMHRQSVRHLPVVENEKVIGIISTRLLMNRREEYLNDRIERRTRELREANELLLARDSEQRYNLLTAGKLQSRMLLPQNPPDWPEFHWAAHYEPLDHLGGDLYDFAQPLPGKLGFLIADASGHSIAAAMVAMFARFAFEQTSRSPSPGEALGSMNIRLQELTDERFVTAFYGIYDRETTEFRYASAGHPYPILHRENQKDLIMLASSGFFLGVTPEEIYMEKTIHLQPGDKICFYTDGIIEARNEIGELFGLERLKQSIQSNCMHSAKELVNKIIDEVKMFCGTAAYTDDVTLVVAEMLKA